MERTLNRKLWIAAALGTLISSGALAGCSMFSPSKAPIDCDVVKTQQQAGKSDTQIAADLTATYNQRGMNYTPITDADVAACHGPEQGGNKNAGMIPSNY
ncbi:MAG TPA: hypothetical protein VEJ86_04010 [Candidatus Binataceae bacterium]|nr:hypothetical protein [Candidatus Binataceae bacterium]